MIMIITTLIINFHTPQSHHMLPIPCNTHTLRYKHPSPREPVCTRCFPTFSPLIYFTFSRIPFDFLLNPSSLSFLCHFFPLLMTIFFGTFFFVFIISESPVHEGSRRDYFCMYLYQRTLADLPCCPLTVSNVSYCISRHSSYLHRHFHKIIFAPFVIIVSDCKRCSVFGVI